MAWTVDILGISHCRLDELGVWARESREGFGLTGGLFILVPNATDWGWLGLLFVYSLMGIGRATFEGTLKAAFADYFPYEREGAFANITVQNGLCGSIGYICKCQTQVIQTEDTTIESSPKRI